MIFLKVPTKWHTNERAHLMANRLVQFIKGQSKWQTGWYSEPNCKQKRTVAHQA